MKKQVQICFSLLALLISLIVLNNSSVCSLKISEIPADFKHEEQKNPLVSSIESDVKKDDLVYRGEEQVYHDLVYHGEEITVLLLEDTLSVKQEEPE